MLWNVNQSSRPILLTAKDSEGCFKIYLVEANTGTPFSKSPCFVVDDPRYKVRRVDECVLVSCRIHQRHSLQAGQSKAKITNDNWGIVLLGWPVAGDDTIGGTTGSIPEEPSPFQANERWPGQN